MKNKNIKEVRKFVRKHGGNEAVRFFNIMMKCCDPVESSPVVTDMFIGMGDRYGRFRYLYVFPDFRGRGLGTSFFKDGMIAQPSKSMISIAFEHDLLDQYEGKYYSNDNYPHMLFNIKYGFSIQEFDNLFGKSCVVNFNEWKGDGFRYCETISLGSKEEAMRLLEKDGLEFFEKIKELDK